MFKFSSTLKLVTELKASNNLYGEMLKKMADLTKTHSNIVMVTMWLQKMLRYDHLSDPRLPHGKGFIKKPPGIFK